MPNPEQLQPPDPNSIRRQLQQERVDRIARDIQSTALIRESSYQGRIAQISKETFFISGVRHSIIQDCDEVMYVVIARGERSQPINAYCEGCGRVDVSQNIFIDWLDSFLKANHTSEPNPVL